MFSENHQISGRQVFRLLTYDILGIGTLLIPTVLSQIAGEDGIFCIMAGVILALIYLKILKGLLGHMGTSYMEYLKQKFKWASVIILVGYFLYFVLMAAHTSCLFTALIAQNLVENISDVTITALILLLVFYGMAGGIEGRARVYEILFWFLMLPLFLMMFAAGKEVEPSYWFPLFQTDGTHMITGSYYVLFCYSMISMIPFLQEYVPEEKSPLYKSSRSAVLFSGALFLSLYLLLEGMFGSPALSHMQFPAVVMMNRVQITGGFLKRTDAFMIGIWFFTLYALLGSMVFYSGNLFGKILEKTGWMEEKKRRMCAYAIVIVIVYILTILLYHKSLLWKMIEEILWKYGTAFVIGVPVFLILFSGKKKRRITMTVMLLAICFLIEGCNVTELEDREFPLYLNVRSEDDFEKQWLNEARTGGKIIDYNHLKVILIEKDFLEDKAAVNEMLTMLKKEHQLPQNTYVFVTEDCDALTATEKNLSLDLGTYLEQMIENGTGIKQNAYPTIGMLYQEQENHLETLFIPYVTVSEGEPVICGYEAWKRGCAEGFTDSSIAYASFFTQNKMEEYALQLAPDQFVKIDSAHCNVGIEEMTGSDGKKEVCIQVKVTGDGEVKKGTADAGLIRERMEDYLNTKAMDGLAQNIDITDSYKKLGGDNRKLYERFLNAPALYEEEIQIKYTVEMNWHTENFFE